MHLEKQVGDRTLGQIECEKNGWSFDEVFRYQFQISEQGAQTPKLSDSWESFTLAGWRVQHCPSLPICHIFDTEGHQLAAILGIAISTGGNCLQAKETYDGGIEAFEEWLEDLAGRFVALTFVQNQGRCYLDPAGNLSVVYDPVEKTIASSVHLLATNALSPHRDIDQNLVLEKKERLLFGETSDRRVMRAKPNHFVSLNDFKEHRHWPKHSTEFAELDQDRATSVDEIAKRLSRNVGALTQTFKCGLPVTAGMDSRIILACATPFLSKISNFYCYRLNQSTLIDAAAAVRLAEQLTVPMLVISRRSPTIKAALTASEIDEEYEKMLMRTGYCSGLRKDWVPYIAQTPPVEVVLRGTGLEMTRANKWTEENRSVPCNSVDGLRTLAGLRPGKQRSPSATRRYESLLARYESWKNTLPPAAQERLYDLAHVELMLPSGPVLEYSAYASHFVVNPFNDRRLYQLTSGIAPRARMQKRLVRRIISHQNKHLLSIPFHRDWGNQRA